MFMLTRDEMRGNVQILMGYCVYENKRIRDTMMVIKFK